jgi:hypothetical protein
VSRFTRADYEATMLGLRPIKAKLEERACSRLADMAVSTCVMFGCEDKFSPRAERFLLIAMDLGERAFILVLFVAFVVSYRTVFQLDPTI